MRPHPVLFLLWIVVPVVTLPLLAETAPPAYHAEFEKGLNGRPFVQLTEQTRDGKTERFVTVRFHVTRADGKSLEPGDRVVLQEDGITVAEIELTQPQIQPIASVLCLDISHSMGSARKLEQAQAASLAFIQRLAPSVNLGLLLFDDQATGDDPNRFVPLADSSVHFPAQRERIRALIQAAKPAGGTAYLDATARAVSLLAPGGKLVRKAIIVMTDGADLASKASLDDVIREALQAKVPVYTIGIGQPGTGEMVTTALVLDRSGSMKGKASTTDVKTKIEALHEAACRFVDLTRPSSRISLLPFSTTVARPEMPISERLLLKRRINEITAEGGTRLYDALLDGIETVAATATKGKRVVVVLTDGKDESPGSRVGPAEIIQRAREEKVTVYTLGLGPENEINQLVLKRLAEATGGRFFRADNQQNLFEVFEKLSLEIYDDGIDTESLEKLALSTGGRYYHIKDAARLELLFPHLARELQETYTATFRSQRQIHDGTARGITLSVVSGSAGADQRVSNLAETGYAVRGLVVVPEVGPVVYLVLLVLLLVLIALPGRFPRRSSSE